MSYDLIQIKNCFKVLIGKRIIDLNFKLFCFCIFDECYREKKKKKLDM